MGFAKALLKTSQVIVARKLPENFDVLMPLDSLNFSDWDIPFLSSEIGKLKNLKKLVLTSDRLWSLPGEIGNLTNLQSLYLNGNQLTILPGEIGNLTNLHWLDLDGNQLTSLPIDALKQLKNLYQLVLKGENGSNPLPASEVEALRQAMPWCEIIF